MRIINCKTCKKEVNIRPYQEGKTLFCSHKCWSVYCKKKWVKKICLGCSKEFFVEPWRRDARYCTVPCRAKNVISRYWLGKTRDSMKGVKNWAWKGGITPVKKLLRHSIEYKTWRDKVFKRDNFTCKECGQHSGYLESHHIIPLKETFSRMFDINNGITLCRPCHIKTMGKEKLFQDKYFGIANVC